MIEPTPMQRRTELDLRQVHPLTIVLELFLWVRQMLFPLILIVIANLRSSGNGSDFLEIALSGVAGIRVVFAAINYLLTRYGFDHNQFIYRTGVIFKKERTIPLDRIQNVEIIRNLAHRILGIADVKIDTGVAGQAEVQLSALRMEEALSLQSELLKRKVGQFELSSPVEEAKHAFWVSSTKDLVYSGLTENRAFLILASATGLFGVGMNNVLEDVVRSVFKGAFRNGDGQIWPYIFGFIGFLFIGWAAGVANAVIKYYGFTIVQQGDRLVRTYGLFTHFQTAIALRRVQTFTAKANWLKLFLGFWEVQAATSGSPIDMEKHGSNVLCPVVPVDDLGKFVHVVFPEVYVDRLSYQRSSPKSVRRMFFQGFWVLVGFTAVFSPIIWVTMEFRNAQLGSMVGQIGIAWAVILAFQYWVAKRTYELSGYSRYLNYTVVKSGFLTRRIIIVPDGKIQSVRMHQSPFSRRMGLADVEINTASHGEGASIMIPNLEEGIAVALHSELSEAAMATGVWQLDGV